MHRRNLLAAAAAIPSARAAWAAEAAEQFPSQQIRIFMPYTAGGAPDLLARAIKSSLEPEWHQPVIVEDHPGANGIVACQLVARAAPDGYILVMGSLATHAINATAYRKLTYDPVRDFTPITEVGRTPLIITGNPKLPAQTLPELIAYAKATPKKLTFASVGQGSLGHLAGLLFQSQAGCSLVHVPYKGISQGSTDLLSGTVDLAFSNVLNVLPFVKSGQLRAYGVTSAESLPILPGVQPVSATLPDYEVTLWWGLFGAARTPEAIADKLATAVGQALRKPENLARWREQGVVLTGSTPGQLAETVKADIAKWGSVVRAANVSL